MKMYWTYMYNGKIVITNKNSVKNTTAESPPLRNTFYNTWNKIAILFAISIVILWDFAILVAILCGVTIPKYCNTLQ